MFLPHTARRNHHLSGACLKLTARHLAEHNF